MIITADYHNHTPRCRHASGSEREYIETAIKRGLKVLGFSDHSPYLFPGDYYSTHRMFPEETEAYYRTLSDLREEYKRDIDIYIGFEAEYYPALFEKMLDLIAPYDFDYLILGQHFLYNEYDVPVSSFAKTSDEARLALYVDQTSEALRTGKYSCFAHPDVINFQGDAAVYERYMRKLLETAHELSIPLEINLQGLIENRPYPRREFFRLAKEMGSEIILGCDAHATDRVATPEGYRLAEAWCDELGLSLISRLKLKKPNESR